MCTRSVLNRCDMGMGSQEVIEKLCLMSNIYKICITFANCIARRFNPLPWLSEGVELPEDISTSWQLSERHPYISMDNYNFKKTPCVLHSTRKGYPKRCLAKAVCSDAYDIFDRYNMGETNKGSCQKKTVFFGTLSQTMGRWGSKVPNLLVKITIQLFLLIFRTLS